MRKECAELLYNEMKTNSKIRVVTADLGFGILDDVRRDFPDRFYNVGAAELLMIGTAIGMAEEGLTPVCYSMSSFLLYRPFEFLRNYVNYEKINIKLLGSGRDKDYSHDGISHWAHDDRKVLEALPNIESYRPMDLAELERDFAGWINNTSPAYLNLTRKI
jgi:transketolase